MSIPIQALRPASPLTNIQPLSPATKGGTGAADFGKMLTSMVDDVGKLQDQAATEVANLAAGKVDNVHQTMLALGKSELAFDYMMEIRNRLVDSYREVMRMPI